MNLVIDGSYGEGGGQILRSTLSLAALLGRSVEIINIRRGRKNPGLQPQHLTAVRAMAAISRAQVTGAQLGSQRLVLTPQSPVGGEYEFDVSVIKASAGSVGLIFQAMAPALFAVAEPSRLTLKGGTHVPWSPPTTYLQSVFLPMLAKLGLRANLETVRWGWYPQGGGIANAEINPAQTIAPINGKDRGELEKIEGVSVVSNLPVSIAERQRDQALRRLAQAGLSAHVEVLEAPSIGKGTFVFMLARYANAVAGFSALGARGKPAEKVADEAFTEFFAHHTSGAAVDKYLADQLVIYLALANGPSAFSTSEVTQHLLTHAWLIEQFLPVRFDIDGLLGQSGVVNVQKFRVQPLG
jgi:RNA 3'-terminal phosphate cyclase (ATP)